MAWAKNRDKKSAPKRPPKRGATKFGGGRRLPPNSLRVKHSYSGAEMYLRYTILEVRTLAHILQSLEEIKADLIPKLEERIGRSLESLPVIHIRHMHTGQSITFNIGGSTVTVNPKKYVVVAALVIGTLYTTFKIYNEFRVASAQAKQIDLENEEKAIDIESKRIDLEKKKAAWEQEKDTAAGKLTLYLAEDKKIKKVMLNRIFVK